MKKYEHDFYGEEIQVIVLGYIRPEYNYTSIGMPFRGFSNVDALIEDIKMDMKVASESLKRIDYHAYKTSDFWSVT